MKLTIFAATGGIGRQALEQALAAGHDVTAVVRNPNKLSGEAVRIVTADLAAADPAALESAVAGADAVLSGLGPRSTSETGIASQGTAGHRPGDAGNRRATHRRGQRRADLHRALARPKPPRHDPGDGFLMRHLFSHVAKTAFRKHYADLALMEDILRDSGLEWTVVRPPRLTDKPLTGSYRVAYGQNLRGGWSVSRADVAQLMLRVLEQPETIKQAIGIAN
jgi:putative NADH-flavin reductase